MFKKNKILLCFYIILDYFFLSIYLSFTLSIYLYCLSIYLYCLSIYLFAYGLSIYLSIKHFSPLFISYIILFYLPLLWTIRPCLSLQGTFLKQPFDIISLNIRRNQIWWTQGRNSDFRNRNFVFREAVSRNFAAWKFIEIKIRRKIP